MIGSISFVLPKPCTRCAVPTIHPITGAYDKRFEPLKTLRTYRSVMSRSSMVQLMMSRSSMAVNDESQNGAVGAEPYYGALGRRSCAVAITGSHIVRQRRAGVNALLEQCAAFW